MISCIVFNCAGVNSYDPIRFAGTWKQYSKKAMPQLTTITFHSASLRNRKCPYHATVMKIFEIVSSRMRSEEHTSELQSQSNLVCRLLLEKKKKTRCTATLIYTTHLSSSHTSTTSLYATANRPSLDESSSSYRTAACGLTTRITDASCTAR